MISYSQRALSVAVVVVVLAEGASDVNAAFVFGTAAVAATISPRELARVLSVLLTDRPSVGLCIY